MITNETGVNPAAKFQDTKTGSGTGAGAGTESGGGGVNVADVLYNCFRLLCIAEDINLFLECLERGNSQVEQSLNLFEWGLILHFYTRGTEVLAITLIQCIETIVLQFLGIFGLDRSYRLIPTTIVGLCSLGHFLLNYNSPTYPVIVSLAKWPEVFSILIIAVVCSLYGITWLLTGGRIRRRPCSLTRANLPKLSDAYALAVFKFGGLCLDAAQSSPLRNEDEPIIIPNVAVIEAALNPDKSSIGFSKREVRPPSNPTSTNRSSYINFLRINTIYTNFVQRILRRRNRNRDDNRNRNEGESQSQGQDQCAGGTAAGSTAELKATKGDQCDEVEKLIGYDNDTSDEEYIDDEEQFTRDFEDGYDQDDFVSDSEDELHSDTASTSPYDTDVDNDNEIYKEVFQLHQDLRKPVYDQNGHLVSSSLLRENDESEDDDSGDDENTVSSIYTRSRSQHFHEPSSSFFSSPDSLSSFILSRRRLLSSPPSSSSLYPPPSLHPLHSRLLPSASSSSSLLPSSQSEFPPQLTTTLHEEVDEDKLTPASHFTNCVVCLMNPRNIVLRPCGCLVLCDECREVLATRRYTHCPTCRCKVESFCKVYVP